jgi:phosphoglycerate dehydrogenase-like enzyme
VAEATGRLLPATASIVGLGSIGRAVARRGLAMGIRVIATIPALGRARAALGVEVVARRDRRFRRHLAALPMTERIVT